MFPSNLAFDEQYSEKRIDDSEDFPMAVNFQTK